MGAAVDLTLGCLLGKFNAHKYNCWDMCRAHVLVYESLLEDPLDQMCGYVHVGNGGNVTGAHITTWNPTDFARLMKWGEVPNIQHNMSNSLRKPTRIGFRELIICNITT